MCKGPYVILQGGSLIEKANNVGFVFWIIWSLGFSLKGDIKGLFSLKKNRAATLYRSEKKIFLSIVERKIFSC